MNVVLIPRETCSRETCSIEIQEVSFPVKAESDTFVVKHASASAPLAWRTTNCLRRAL